jgi:hypothetical protein
MFGYLRADFRQDAHYCYDPRAFDGIVVPTSRRVVKRTQTAGFVGADVVPSRLHRRPGPPSLTNAGIDAMRVDATRFVETEYGRLAYRTDWPERGVPLVLAQRFRGTMDDWELDSSTAWPLNVGSSDSIAPA